MGGLLGYPETKENKILTKDINKSQHITPNTEISCSTNNLGQQ